MANLVRFTDPLGQTTQYGYDALGQLIKTTDAAGGTTTYTYDAAGNQTSGHRPAGNTTTDTYDADNRLATSTDALGAEGGPTPTMPRATSPRETDRDGRIRQFAYDALGRRRAETWLDGTGARSRP